MIENNFFFDFEIKKNQFFGKNNFLQNLFFFKLKNKYKIYSLILI